VEKQSCEPKNKGLMSRIVVFPEEPYVGKLMRQLNTIQREGGRKVTQPNLSIAIDQGCPDKVIYAPAKWD
jgi:hypothetical protein